MAIRTPAQKISLIALLAVLVLALFAWSAPSMAATAAAPGTTPPAAGTTTSTDQNKTTPSWNFDGHQRTITVTLTALAAFLAGIGVLMAMAGLKPDDPYISKLKASFFFWLGIGYTVVLLVLAALYNIVWEGRTPYLFGDLLPLAVPWFGALGAVTISLEGVFHWSQRNWSTDFNYWHLGRPIFGAVLGIVAFFLFVLIVSSAGTAPAFLETSCSAQGAHCAPKDFIIYYVLAFLVGYREETFRELIRRVTDLILKPSDKDVPAIVFRFNGQAVDKLDFPNTPANTPATITIQIHNTGKGALAEPALKITPKDAASTGRFALVADPFGTLKELGAGQTVDVDVTFTPNAQSKFSATLAVTGKNLKAVTLPLNGTGT